MFLTTHRSISFIPTGGRRDKINQAWCIKMITIKVKKTLGKRCKFSSLLKIQTQLGEIIVRLQKRAVYRPLWLPYVQSPISPVAVWEQA